MTMSLIVMVGPGTTVSATSGWATIKRRGTRLRTRYVRRRVNGEFRGCYWRGLYVDLSSSTPVTIVSDGHGPIKTPKGKRSW